MGLDAISYFQFGEFKLKKPGRGLGILSCWRLLGVDGKETMLAVVFHILIVSFSLIGLIQAQYTWNRLVFSIHFPSQPLPAAQLSCRRVASIPKNQLRDRTI